MNFVLFYSDAKEILYGKLSVCDDGVGGAIDEVSQLWLKPALIYKGDIFSVAVCDEGDTKSLLQKNSDKTLRIEVAAVDDIRPVSERRYDAGKHRADGLRYLKEAVIGGGFEASLDSKRAGLFLEIKLLPAVYFAGDDCNFIAGGRDSFQQVVVVDTRASGVGQKTI